MRSWDQRWDQEVHMAIMGNPAYQVTQGEILLDGEMS